MLGRGPNTGPLSSSSASSNQPRSHILLRRVGLTASFFSIIVHIDSCGFHGIFPTQVRNMLANLTTAMIYHQIFDLNLVTMGALRKILNLPPPTVMAFILSIMIAVTYVMAIAAGIGTLWLESRDLSYAIWIFWTAFSSAIFGVLWWYGYRKLLSTVRASQFSRKQPSRKLLTAKPSSSFLGRVFSPRDKEPPPGSNSSRAKGLQGRPSSGNVKLIIVSPAGSASTRNGEAAAAAAAPHSPSQPPPPSPSPSLPTGQSQSQSRESIEKRMRGYIYVTRTTMPLLVIAVIAQTFIAYQSLELSKDPPESEFGDPETFYITNNALLYLQMLALYISVYYTGTSHATAQQPPVHPYYHDNVHTALSRLRSRQASMRGRTRNATVAPLPLPLPLHQLNRLRRQQQQQQEQEEGGRSPIVSPPLTAKVASPGRVPTLAGPSAAAAAAARVSTVAEGEEEEQERERERDGDVIVEGVLEGAARRPTANARHTDSVEVRSGPETTVVAPAAQQQHHHRRDISELPI